MGKVERSEIDCMSCDDCGYRESGEHKGKYICSILVKEVKQPRKKGWIAIREDCPFVDMEEFETLKGQCIINGRDE